MAIVNYILLRLVVIYEYTEKTIIKLYYDQISIDTNHFTIPNKESIQAALYDYLHSLQVQ